MQVALLADAPDHRPLDLVVARVTAATAVASGVTLAVLAAIDPELLSDSGVSILTRARYLVVPFGGLWLLVLLAHWGVRRGPPPRAADLPFDDTRAAVELAYHYRLAIGPTKVAAFAPPPGELHHRGRLFFELARSAGVSLLAVITLLAAMAIYTSDASGWQLTAFFFVAKQVVKALTALCELAMRETYSDSVFTRAVMLSVSHGVSAVLTPVILFYVQLLSRGATDAELRALVDGVAISFATTVAFEEVLLWGALWWRSRSSTTAELDLDRKAEVAHLAFIAAFPFAVAPLSPWVLAYGPAAAALAAGMHCWRRRLCAPAPGLVFDYHTLVALVFQTLQYVCLSAFLAASATDADGEFGSQLPAWESYCIFVVNGLGVVGFAVWHYSSPEGGEGEPRERYYEFVQTCPDMLTASVVFQPGEPLRPLARALRGLGAWLAVALYAVVANAIAVTLFVFYMYGELATVPALPYILFVVSECFGLAVAYVLALGVARCFCPLTKLTEHEGEVVRVERQQLRDLLLAGCSSSAPDARFEHARKAALKLRLFQTVDEKLGRPLGHVARTFMYRKLFGEKVGAKVLWS